MKALWTFSPYSNHAWQDVWLVWQFYRKTRFLTQRRGTETTDLQIVNQMAADPQGSVPFIRYIFVCKSITAKS